MAKDVFSQIAYIHVVESAANTLTFAGLSVFTNVLSQQGMVLHRVEYSLTSATISELAASSDRVSFGLTGSNSLTSTVLSDPEVYDERSVKRQDMGTAGNAILVENPIVADWTMLPGGGKLVPADRLYGYIQGTSLTNPTDMHVRIYFTLLDMSAADYLELAQSMRVLK